MKEVNISNPRYTDFEFADESIWLHDLCIEKVKRDKEDYNDYIKLTVESIEKDYLVEGWHEAAIEVGAKIKSGNYLRLEVL